MMGRLQLILPPMIAYKKDIFGMIPSPPIGLACLAAFMRENGVAATVLDCFAQAPYLSAEYRERFVRIGLSEEQILERIDPQAALVGISVHSGMTAAFCLDLAQAVQKRFGKRVVLGGPHISVTYRQCLNRGIDFAVIGEGEAPLLELVLRIAQGLDCAGIPGVAMPASNSQAKRGNTVDMDKLPFPAWDLVPLDRYWALRMSHSPVAGRFAPMITSRGCPYNCAFCSTPTVSGRKWRAYSPERTVREIRHLKNHWRIEDVFIQDDNFNFDSNRVIEICDLLARERLGVRLSLPSGVRLDTMNDAQIDALARGGFRYLCLAPESGSKRVRARMQKPLDEQKLKAVQRRCKKNRIRTGAFIIIGSPGETISDILKTAGLIAKLLWHGADDVSIFIYSPVPGSRLAAICEDPLPPDYLGVCWTPKWRRRFNTLSKTRMLLYGEYLLLKILFQPFSGVRHLRNIFNKTFETKGEMGLSRWLAGFIGGKSDIPWKSRVRVKRRMKVIS